MRDPPDRNMLLALHSRLLGGDRLAPGELAQAVLPLLLDELRRKFPRTDEQLVADGVVDAVLDYSTRPQQFDASHDVPLDRFLSAAAWRNASNLLRGEHRRKRRERAVGGKKRQEGVVLDPAAGNIRREELRELEDRKKAILDALENPTDREIMALRLDGVRDAGPFARVLGLTHLTEPEQREQVRRHKDRITRFLRRKGLLP